MNRRQMLSSSTAAAAATLATLGSSPQALAQSPAPALGKGSVILFQGDSITDAGRNRNEEGKANSNAMLGQGYPFHLAGQLLADHGPLGLSIYNRGISGNKVPDLDARWQKDCLDLKPALVSILIGVNDIWHKLNGRYKGTPETYRDGFAALLEKTRKALPDVRLVICEPFVLRCGAVNDKWFPEFDQRRAFAAQVAKQAGATWVPFQEAFDAALKTGTEPAYWAADGVHPTLAGHALMAKTWRTAVGL
ncbi:MAG: SGNH/GDSL hydrolase family protein [Akkermansiaceae bacterium]|jgi:lysophospholipase L1-like esterase|nr:SGNH/GDSL hydrolase family protein [Akkermansiaceae bacterium]